MRPAEREWLALQTIIGCMDVHVIRQCLMVVQGCLKGEKRVDWKTKVLQEEWYGPLLNVLLSSW